MSQPTILSSEKDQSGTPTPSFLRSVKLEKKLSTGEIVSYELFSEQTVSFGNNVLLELLINQSMFTPYINGHIELLDKGDWSGELNLTGFETIVIKFLVDGDLDYRFRIYEAKPINDFVKSPRTNQVEKASIYRLEFISEDVFNVAFTENVLKSNKDFIGFISVKPESNGQVKGLINEIFKKFNFTAYEIEETKNGIWLRAEEISLPSGFERKQLNLIQLLNYLAKNAVSSENPYAVNFFCWKDFNGWHFKSLEKMLKEQKDKQDEELPFYILNTDDLKEPKRVRSIKVESQYNVLELLENHSLFSYYKRTEPDYENPYSDFIDDVRGMTFNYIDYDYHRDFNKTLHVEKHKLVPETFVTNTNENNIYKPILKQEDFVFSFYGSEKYHRPFNEWSMHSADRGFGVKPENSASIWWNYLGRTADSRWSNITYQPNFNLTSLDISKFYDIYHKIRLPLIETRQEFARKKNIKRMWEVYRCAVCCMGNASFGGTADNKLLEELQGITSGITYNILYGATGIFADMQQEYRVVAAGSFTDLINYDIKGTTHQNGLTFSYDLTKEPYNQTIGQFYNLKEEIPNYIKYAIGDSLKIYDEMIDFLNKKVEIIQGFAERANGYITSLNSWYDSIELDSYEDLIVEGESVPNDSDTPEPPIPEYPNKYVTQRWEWPYGSCYIENEFTLIYKVDTSDGSLNIIPFEITNPNSSQWNFPHNTSYYSWTNFTTPYYFGRFPALVYTPDGEIKYIGAYLPRSGLIKIFGTESGGYGSPFFKLNIPLTSGQTTFTFPYFKVPAYFSLPNFDNGLEHKYLPTDGISPGNVPVGSNNYELIEDQSLQQVPIFVKECSKEKYMFGNRKFVYNLSVYNLIHNEWGTPSEWSKFRSTRIQTSNLNYFPQRSSKFESSGKFLYGPGIDIANSFESFSDAADYYYLTDNDNIGNNPNSLKWLDGEYYTDYAWSLPTQIREKFDSKWSDLMNCVDEGNCYNRLCFNPILVEIAKRLAEQELQVVIRQREVYTYLRDLIKETYENKWKELYTEWWNREAFFISKQVGTSIFTGVSGGRNLPLDQDLSLYNIKKITRKEIKGSRYEILAKANKGIIGASAGQWLYNIYFGNNEENDPNDLELQNIHPYYNQKYDVRKGKSAFITKRKLYNFYQANTTDPLNNQPWITERILPLRSTQSIEKQYVIADSNEITSVFQYPLWENFGYAQTHLNYHEEFSELDYIYAYNIFEDDLTEKKPPNIKKEEIASYVRIEFINPIGLDRIADFPNGFMRDPGSEYFLPYLVQITPGPNGRQTIRNNIAIIGMDPYGFDVAIKKQKIETKCGSREYSWWDKYSPIIGKSGLSDNGMELWPESGFNVEFPYYTTDLNSSVPEVKNGTFYDINFYSGKKFDINTNPGFYSKEIDSEYKESSLGSGYLLASHKKFKPHRSWWSFYFPRNLFLFQKLEPAISTFFNTKTKRFGIDSYDSEFYSPDKSERVGGSFVSDIRNQEDCPIPYRTQILTNTPISKRNEIENKNYNTEYITGKENIDSRLIKPLDQDDDSTLSVKLLKNQDSREEYPYEDIQSHTDDSLEDEVRKYFKDDVLHWLNANYALYRPGLVTSDIWKYDLSGETEYGLTTPPIDDVNYDLFDQNFAAQFVVFARATSICKEFTCANPEGLVDSSSCPQDNPYCNCPAQDKMPNEPEPTYLELYQLYNKIKECDLIEENLGKDYLGCIWSDPNNPCSCNCPEVGKKFGEYLAYTRTYASFWSTPVYAPLFRIAQIQQFKSQQILIRISANNTRVNIGDTIYLRHDNPQTEDLFINETKNLNGRWVITGISHRFLKETVQFIEIILNRDTLSKPQDTGNNAKTAYLLA